ncbi:phenylalanine--tRNA ligase alpha subunit-like [Oppia nitens]|uniref:phenylalanine--tRNA ligase alpha subunit-like n=1 Tax=Oppia nitens TaxID=1686743 RepID=UPI0023D9942F|nr:phenylalanine--tRNA ligase alpha subunit-like [Oppia nitens]
MSADNSLAEDILKLLDKRQKLNSLSLSNELSIDHQRLVGAIKSLQSIGELIRCQQTETKRLDLTQEGRHIADNGSHEAIVFNAVPAGDDGGIEQSLLMKIIGNPSVAKLGFSKAMSQKWIAIDKSSNKSIVKRNVQSIEDEVQVLLKKIGSLTIDEVSDQQKQDLKKRKLIQEVVVKSYDIEKGDNFTLNIVKQETDLTAEMISKNTWKDKQFKDYNFDAMGIAPDRGHLHPLLKVREQFRQIFLEMGFSEMPTNRFVESSFWNFDALFVPQKHPARDLQDTFFLADPANCTQLPVEYMEKVRSVHSSGDFGSQGYQYDWKTEETQKNVLRTHTTAVSARMLYQLAQECQRDGKPFKAAKLFSIDRVFRNETLDATHLAEFHQIEGVVADVGVTLGDLMGLIQEFFLKLGIKRLRFKPTYNPYTEPSMEVYSYHDGLKKWVEIGNSGVFRPEMLLPMGLPPNVNVLGWGLGLERPTMIKYGIDNIRDLCGHKVDLQMVYDNPVCILENH